MWEKTFRIDHLPGTQADVHRDWFVRNAYRKRWHKRVAEAVLVAGSGPPAPLSRAEVVCVRHSAREADPDNVTYSFKSILDGFVKAGVLADDTSEVVDLTTSWEYEPPNRGHIVVTIRASDA